MNVLCSLEIVHSLQTISLQVKCPLQRCENLAQLKKKGWTKDAKINKFPAQKIWIALEKILA